MRTYFPECPLSSRPQILALSASPAGGKDLKRTRTQLQELRRTLHAEIVAPYETKGSLEDVMNDCKTVYKAVCASEMERRVSSALHGHMRHVGARLEGLIDGEIPSLLSTDIFSS